MLLEGSEFTLVTAQPAPDVDEAKEYSSSLGDDE
jgi:hypothetical protein